MTTVANAEAALKPSARASRYGRSTSPTPAGQQVRGRQADHRRPKHVPETRPTERREQHAASPGAEQICLERDEHRGRNQRDARAADGGPDLIQVDAAEEPPDERQRQRADEGGFPGHGDASGLGQWAGAQWLVL